MLLATVLLRDEVMKRLCALSLLVLALLAAAASAATLDPALWPEHQRHFLQDGPEDVSSDVIAG